MTSIVIAINTIYFFALPNGSVFFSFALFVYLAPSVSLALNASRTTQRSGFNVCARGFIFITIISLVACCWLHGHPRDTRFVHSALSIRLPIYGKWILFVRALMCKPLNNHKIKIIARKIWNEKIVIYITFVVRLTDWLTAGERERKKEHTNEHKFAQ